MSLNIFYFKKDNISKFVVEHYDLHEREIYNNIEDIPKCIRHFAPKQPAFPNVESALHHGVLDIFYPNHPNCGLKGYENSVCIGQGCIYSEKNKGDYTLCPYYKSYNIKN